jgi:hypothetical protein
MSDVEHQQQADATLLCMMLTADLDKIAHRDWPQNSLDDQKLVQSSFAFFGKLGLIRPCQVTTTPRLTVSFFMLSELTNASAKIEEAIFLRFLHLARNETGNQKLSSASLGNAITSVRLKSLFEAAITEKWIKGVYFSNDLYHLQITTLGCHRFDTLLESFATGQPSIPQTVHIQTVENLQYGSNNVIASDAPSASMRRMLAELQNEIGRLDIPEDKAKKAINLVQQLNDILSDS